MKKLLVLMLVLCLSSAASAELVEVSVSLIDPEVTVDTVGVRIYIDVDLTGLEDITATITASGDATITGGTLAAEAEFWGAEVTYFTHDTSYNWKGGWQDTLSFDTYISGAGSKSELGLAHFGSDIYGATSDPIVTVDTDLSGSPYVAFNTPIAYLDIVATGAGSVTLTMVGGSKFGSANPQIIGYGSSLVLSTIPEPMTVVLLGLGSLFLMRRRK